MIYYSNLFNVKTKSLELKELVLLETPWFVLYSLIPFLMSIVIFGYIIPNINFKIGIPINMLEINEYSNTTQTTKFPTSIWIGVKIINQDVLIVTDERKIFKWKYDTENPNMSEFIKYLQKRTKFKLFTQVLLHTNDTEPIRVGIACDENIRFFHIKPIILALAEAGISDYYFEIQTKISDLNTIKHKSM